MKRSVWLGFDAREAACYAVARDSVSRNFAGPINGLNLYDLRHFGLYRRPTSRVEGRLYDDISEAPMSTEFAISRFLTPILAETGLALFMDADVLVRRPLDELFDSIDLTKAVSVVKHDFAPTQTVKMDGQAQTQYPRKNWSSVMVFNCDHPANKLLSLDLINAIPGRDLHRFCWLQDEQIGDLDPAWNFLVGHTDPAVDPAIVHFTDGAPFMPGYEDCAYADEWRSALARWAA